MSVLAAVAAVVASIMGWELLRPALREARECVRIWQIRRQARTRLEKDMAELAALKAKIVSVGEVEQCPGGIRLTGDWGFDCSNGAIPHRVDAKGVPYYCGYTDKELVEIWKRRDEYVTRERD